MLDGSEDGADDGKLLGHVLGIDEGKLLGK